MDLRRGLLVHVTRMNPSYIHKSRFLMCHVGHKSGTALALRYFVSVTLNERLDRADCCFEFAEVNRI